MADPNQSSLDGVGGDGQTRPDEARTARLNALGETLAKKRSDAISARQNSGIEQQWREDEEFYAGVDDANRNEFRNSWRTKPPGQYQAQVKGTTRSTVFPNITRPYVDAAAARIADMLLPTDDRSWSIKPTPIPDLVGISEGDIPDDILRQLSAPTQFGQPDQAAVNKAKQAIIQQAKEEQDEAKKKAEKAEKRIEDWNVEGQWHAEVRQVIEDAARCGTGVLKGPFPVKRKVVALIDVGADEKPTGSQGLLSRLVGGIKKRFGMAQQVQKALIVKEEIKPTSRRIDYWDFYPSGSCGGNMHDGELTFERDRLTAKKFQELKGGLGYIDSQIDECLREGPKKAIAEDKDTPNKYLDDADDARYEIWYFHGVLGKEDLTAAGCDCGDNEHPLIPAMVVMVNNRVIKAALNPLDSGDFPYDMMPWQRKDGMPWGDGVARQGRTAQKIVVGGARNLMDNGGLSAGPQIVMKQGSITPADTSGYSLTPRKIWFWGEDGDAAGKVTDAMTFFNVPSMQKELMEIIQFGMKLMEDSTGLPMLLQGQQGKAPETVGGMTLLNNNATAVLRRLARTFDDKITEPHIRRYYTWLLQHGEDDEKGDFTIDARGSSALVERDMQSQQMPQLLQFSGNPVFKLDPAKCMEETLKSWHLDPARFQFDDEKWQQIVENMSKAQADPRLQVEQMRQENADKEREFKAAEAAKDRQLALLADQVNERIAEIKAGNASEISFADLKGMLADTAIKVSAQKEIAAATLAADIHKHHSPSPVLSAPVEPPGKAPNGEAFAR
jgi:hypothetical protein